MSEIDWQGILLGGLALWQAYKELRTKREQKRAAEELVKTAVAMGPLAQKMARDLEPVFVRAAKIGEGFRRHQVTPPPADTTP